MLTIAVILIAFLFAIYNISNRKLKFTFTNIVAHTGLMVVLGLLGLAKFITTSTIKWARIEVEISSAILMIREETSKNVN